LQMKKSSTAAKPSKNRKAVKKQLAFCQEEVRKKAEKRSVDAQCERLYGALAAGSIIHEKDEFKNVTKRL